MLNSGTAIKLFSGLFPLIISIVGATAFVFSALTRIILRS